MDLHEQPAEEQPSVEHIPALLRAATGTPGAFAGENKAIAAGPDCIGD